MQSAPRDQSKQLQLLETWQRHLAANPANTNATAVISSHSDDSFAGKSILLVGAMGLVGVCCLHTWLTAGANVTALTRRAEKDFTHPRLTWLEGDLTDPASWATWQSLPDIVIFTAPIWLLPPLLPTLVQHRVKRIVVFSSTSVHTKAQSGKSMERELAARLQASEAAVLAAGAAHQIGVTILRPTLIYGIGLDKNVASLARVIKRLPFFPLPLRANGLRQPVHAFDLAAATLQVVAAPNTAGHAYDVGGGERLTYRAMIRRIAQQLGKPIMLPPIPALAYLMDFAGLVLRRATHSYGEAIRRMQKDMVFDDSDARRDFGWNPRPFLDVARQPAETDFF